MFRFPIIQDCWVCSDYFVQYGYIALIVKYDVHGFTINTETEESLSIADFSFGIYLTLIVSHYLCNKACNPRYVTYCLFLLVDYDGGMNRVS